MLILALYFAIASWSGLHAYFSLDDGGNLLNMHGYWSHSLGHELASAAVVITPAYRPLGGIYYFVLFKLAGYHPLPFRAVCLAMMLANLLLAFALLRDLAGSLAAAMLAAILVVNHPAVLELLYSSGTIYEILCFFFYFLAIRWYFRWRRTGPLSWRRVAVILILTGCALDSKEMAMTLPGALLLLELIYFPAHARSWRAVIVTAGLTVPAVAIKVFTRNPLSNDTFYHQHSAAATVEHYRAYQHFLLYGMLSPEGFSTAALLVLWTLMAVAAIRWRSRPMIFGLCFLIVSLVPVCVIPPRGGYMLYIPLMGWALYLGCLFQHLADDLVRALGATRWAAASRFGALAIAAAFLANSNAAELAPYRALFEHHQAQSRLFIEQLRGLHPRLPRGSSLLLVDDRLDDGYEPLFLARLAYSDPTLELDRTRMLPAAPQAPALLRYDFVLGGQQLQDMRSPADSRSPAHVRIKPWNGEMVVEAPEFAGATVDIVPRSIAGDHYGPPIPQQHCILDSSGQAKWKAPNSTGIAIEPRWIRPAGGAWMAAAIW